VNFSLEQNYPNPFNPQTKIGFSISSPGLVILKIFGITGSEEATLINQPLAAGNYTYEWNAEGFSSGIYIYRLTVGDYSTDKKMVLVK
jgi:hypothetical protein